MSAGCTCNFEQLLQSMASAGPLGLALSSATSRAASPLRCISEELPGAYFRAIWRLLEVRPVDDKTVAIRGVGDESTEYGG